MTVLALFIQPQIEANHPTRTLFVEIVFMQVCLSNSGTSQSFLATE